MPQTEAQTPEILLKEFIEYMESQLEAAKKLHEQDDLVDGQQRLDKYEFAIKRAKGFLEWWKRNT